jgi:hypothetical protein
MRKNPARVKVAFYVRLDPSTKEKMDRIAAGQGIYLGELIEQTFGVKQPPQSAPAEDPFADLDFVPSN